MSNTFFNNIPLQETRNAAARDFVIRVYGWMVGALAISGAAGYFIANNRQLLIMLFGNRLAFPLLILAQLGLVIGLTAGIRKMSFSAALLIFLGYSILNGVNLSVIFLVYAGGSIAKIFVITALMFGSMSTYGMLTKTDLNSAGRYLMMGLVGIAIASVVNIFFSSSSLDWLISFAAVGIFTGLTAYDSQKILQLSIHAQDTEDYQKAALIGALELYLDFINIFIALMRLYGQRKE